MANKIRILGPDGLTVRQRHPAEYEIWKSAKQRCFNPKQARYEDYGGRGITMCDRWRDSFAAFIEDMGPRPEGPERLTLERENNNGPYAPANCKWRTYIHQSSNMRKSGLTHVLEAGESPETHKYCFHCKKVLPKNEFSPYNYVSPRTRTHDGLRPECKPCRRGSAAQERKRRKERLAATPAA